ncbi:MAG: outer membrane beta-barrel protein [Bacteroidaceae bacterium]|nr:outer membrane beta-barrel protein [Bacteroidaceae bacterium]
MRKFASLVTSLFCCSVLVMAQQGGNLELRGSLFDFDSAEPLFPGNVQLYTLPDSTYVNGASTEDDGSFVFTKLKPGEYCIKASYIGYHNTTKSFTLKSNTNLGKVTMKADAKVLDDVVISAAVEKVKMVADTMMFNTDAYRLPEGATVEELVRKLPGVQISSDGNITVNGKTVSRIYVNGKEFFGNDKSVAMQNLTAEMIEKVKAYDKQSDMTRMTGIDDGNEETVLDLQVRKGMAKGWFGNFNAGYGRPLEKNEFNVNNLYNVQVSLNRFDEDRQMSIIANGGNSTSGMAGGFGGMRGMGGMGGGGGVNQRVTAGLNFARNLGREINSESYQFEIGGSVNYNYNNSKNQTKSASENFYTGNTHTWGNSYNESNSKSNGINGQIRFEWNQSEMTSLLFTPSVSYTKSNSNSYGKNATFGSDPYEWTENPLQAVDSILIRWQNNQFAIDDNGYGSIDPLMDAYDSLELAIRNAQNSLSKSNSSTLQTSGRIMFTQRFSGKKGRNMSFTGNYSYNNGKSKDKSRNDQYAVTQLPGGGFSSPASTPMNRYNDRPNDRINLSAQLSYTEPIAKQTFLQFSYQFSYAKSNSDRATYDLGNITNWGTWNADSTAYLWDLPANYKSTLDPKLSEKDNYYNYDQTAQIQLRKVSDNVNFTVGLSVLPQISKMDYNHMGLDTVLSRTVFNFTPSLSYRYRWTRQEQINISYNGRSAQPDMPDMIDIRDDSNPLAIKEGNPGLKPTFSHNINVRYNKSNPQTMSSFSVNGSFSTTLRSISTKTTLMENFGTISKPVNLDGPFSNWNTSLNFTHSYNMLDARLSISNRIQGNYQHQEGWAQVFGGESQLRTSKNIGANTDLELAYRDDWIEVSLRGDLRFNSNNNDLQPERNMNTFDFSYGPSFSGLLPWQNIRIATDIEMSSRRGYASKEANTNELIWNASASVSFFRGNTGTLQVSVYDILRQRSTINRTVTATSRRDTYTNNINTYFMVNFIYRLSMFGTKETRANMRNARGMRGGMGGGMMMGGGGMGGFGGGMGGGMGGFGGGFGGGMGGFGGGF